MKPFYLVLLCFYAVSCVIAEPDEKILHIRAVNNTDVALEDFWAYTLTFGSLNSNQSSATLSTPVPEGLYRSRSHQISFRTTTRSYWCYGPQLLSDSTYSVVIEGSQQDSLFAVYVEGEEGRVPAEVFSIEFVE